MKYIKEQDEKIIGCHLFTEDGFYIVGLDYDEFKLEFLISELKMIQQLVKLSNIYILQTNNIKERKPKYHAVCFDKVFIKIYREILLNSHVDPKFRSDFNLAFGEPKVLRVGEKRGNDKPFLVTTIKSKYRSWQQSTPHKYLYAKFGIIPYKKSKLEDNFSDVPLVFYHTFRFKQNHQKIFNDLKKLKQYMDTSFKELKKHKGLFYGK